MSSTNSSAMNGGVAAVCVRGPMRGMVRLNMPPSMIPPSSSVLSQQGPTLLSPLPLPPRLVCANPIQLQLSKHTIKQILQSDNIATEEKYEKLKQIVEYELLDHVKVKEPKKATGCKESSASYQSLCKESIQSGKLPQPKQTTQPKQSTQPKQPTHSKQSTQSNQVTKSKQLTKLNQTTQSKQTTHSKQVTAAQSKQDQLAQAAKLMEISLSYENYEKTISLIKSSIEDDSSVCPKKLAEITGLREELVRRIIKKFFFIRYVNGRYREIKSARKAKLLAENRLIYEDIENDLEVESTTTSTSADSDLAPATCDQDLSV